MNRTAKWGLAIFAISFVGVAIASGLEKDARRPSKRATKDDMSLGSTWTHRFQSTARSAKGYHRVASVSARFVSSQGQSVDLVARAVDERPWTIGKELGRSTPDPELLGEPIWPSVKIEAPEEALLVGQAGEIEIRGQLGFPAFQVDLKKHAFDLVPGRAEFHEKIPVRWIPAHWIPAPRKEGATENGEKEDDGEKKDDTVRWYQGALMGSLILGLALILVSIVGVRVLAVSGTLILVPIFIITIYYGGRTRSAEPDSLVPGLELTLRPQVSASAVNMYHQLSNLSAFVRGVGDQQIELEVRSTNDKPWPNVINTKAAGVGPVFKTNRDPIPAEVKVDLPPSEVVAGKTATLVVAGVVDFPDISTADIMLKRLGGSFDITSKRFRTERQLRFAKAGETPKPQVGAPGWLEIPAGIGGAILMAAIGLRIWRYFRG